MVERLEIKRSNEEFILALLAIDRRKDELNARYSTASLSGLINELMESRVLGERHRLAIFDALYEAELNGKKTMIHYLSGQSEPTLENDVEKMKKTLSIILPENGEQKNV